MLFLGENHDLCFMFDFYIGIPTIPMYFATSKMNKKDILSRHSLLDSVPKGALSKREMLLISSTYL